MLIHPAEHWPARRSPQFGYRMRGRRSISELLRPSQESSSSLKGQFVTCENRNGSTREEVDSGKGCPGFWKKLQPLDRAPRGERSGRDPVQPARRSVSPPGERPEELITPPVYYLHHILWQTPRKFRNTPPEYGVSLPAPQRRSRSPDRRSPLPAGPEYSVRSSP